MEGNDGDGCKDSYSSSSVEMDVYESNLLDSEETLSHGEAPFHICPPPFLCMLFPSELWMIKFTCLNWSFTFLCILLQDLIPSLQAY